MLSLVLILGLAAFLPGTGFEDWDQRETMEQVRSRLAEKTLRAYEASPFSALSKDYFSRFHLDLEATPAADEIEIGSNWRILLSPASGPLTRLMAGQLKEFLARSMLRDLPIEEASKEAPHAIFLSDQGGGVSGEKESFTIAAGAEGVEVRGRSQYGLRDGVVKLVERLGLRRAPFLKKEDVFFRPRLAVRLGAVPFLGSYRDLLFMGYNAALVGGGNLHALSTSDAIPELRVRRRPELLARGVDEAAAARRFGLKTYSLIHTQQKFAPDDPLFRTHPEIRGAVTWKDGGDCVLCTEHPLVRRYLGESVEGLFRSDPALDGLVVIIGGEGFYHCFMRPFGVAKGHTNCPRCEKRGAERVVADLLNLMAGAARRVNPRAEIVAWPYSAEFVWSADRFQEGNDPKDETRNSPPDRDREGRAPAKPEGSR